jgi:hypothetical protein
MRLVLNIYKGGGIIADNTGVAVCRVRRVMRYIIWFVHALFALLLNIYNVLKKIYMKECFMSIPLAQILDVWHRRIK